MDTRRGNSSSWCLNIFKKNALSFGSTDLCNTFCQNSYWLLSADTLTHKFKSYIQIDQRNSETWLLKNKTPIFWTQKKVNLLKRKLPWTAYIIRWFLLYRSAFIQEDLCISFRNLQFGTSSRGSEIIIHSIRSNMDAHPDYDILLADGINAFNSASCTQISFQRLTVFPIIFLALHPIFGIPWIQLLLLQSHQQKASNRVTQHLLYSIALQFMISLRIFIISFWTMVQRYH